MARLRRVQGEKLTKPQKYDWEKLHPFQRRSFKRFPPETEFVPEISAFEPLSSLQHGIKNGKIVLVNGTVITDIDEVCLSRISRLWRYNLNIIFYRSSSPRATDAQTNSFYRYWIRMLSPFALRRTS